MIPLNIANPIVLRRVLEEFESRITIEHSPVTPVDPLPLGSDLATVEMKLNELITAMNAVITELDLNNTSDLS